MEHSGLSVVAAVAAPEEADESLASAVPEFVLIDAPEHGEQGAWVERLKALRVRFRAARVVLLADRVTPQWLAVSWQAGLDGYLSKDSEVPIFSLQLSLILAGERVFAFDLVSRFVKGDGRSKSVVCEPALPASVSPSEIELLRHILAGFRNKMIARSLNIGESAVKSRVKSVFRKIHAANRTQAAIWASSHGIEAVLDNANRASEPLRPGCCKGGNFQN